MQNILTSIISHDQTAYVKGRYTGKSIRLISDILLEYTEDNSMGGIIFSADFKKAFDSVEHMFIFATLQSFGFGLRFIQWVRTIFRNTKNCVMNNGHYTGYFSSERGTGQGDPLSAYLFILCLKSVNDVLMIWKFRGALPFRKNTHVQDISSLQTTLRMYDESIQQVSN